MSAAPNLPPYHNEPLREPLEFRPPQRPARARWKKVLAWSAGILLFLILAAVVTTYVLLHNESFHRYVLNKAKQQAVAALGTNVQVRDFALKFHGISPSLDLYDVVVNGASPYPTPPLLTVDHIHLAVRMVSLFSKTWYIDDATVNHPVVHVFIDAHGTDNLPQTKGNEQTQSNTSIFDL